MSSTVMSNGLATRRMHRERINCRICVSVHRAWTHTREMLGVHPDQKDAAMFTFLLGLSFGASARVFLAAICFANHLRIYDDPIGCERDSGPLHQTNGHRS